MLPMSNLLLEVQTVKCLELLDERLRHRPMCFFNGSRCRASFPRVRVLQGMNNATCLNQVRLHRPREASRLQ